MFGAASPAALFFFHQPFMPLTRTIIATLPLEGKARFWQQELTDAGFSCQLDIIETNNYGKYRLSVPYEEGHDAKDYKKGMTNAIDMLSDIKAYTRGLLRGISIIEATDPELMRRAAAAGIYKPKS